MPDSSLRIRTGTLSDRELLLAMMVEFYAEERIAFEAVSARAAVEELLSTPALGFVLFLELDGKAVGYLVAIHSFILEFGGRQTFLDEFYVAQEWRGRGFGRQALATVEELAREKGSRALRLEVDCGNMRARTMYEAAGFLRHDRYTMTKVLAG